MIIMDLQSTFVSIWGRLLFRENKWSYPITICIVTVIAKECSSIFIGHFMLLDKLPLAYTYL